MRVHFDVLGWLYIVAGMFGVLTGLSLLVLAFGTAAAVNHPGALPGPAAATVWLLVIAGTVFTLPGAAMVVVGRAVVRRGAFGRHAALVLAVLNLFVVPFGTALAVYAFWSLLNDEARREFGHPPRNPVGR